jgi:hypothetical protein
LVSRVFLSFVNLFTTTKIFTFKILNESKIFYWSVCRFISSTSFDSSISLSIVVSVSWFFSESWSLDSLSAFVILIRKKNLTSSNYHL